MTFTSYLMGVASDYTVHMIFIGSLVQVSYDHTVYYIEHYNSFLLWETCVTLRKILQHIPFEHYNSPSPGRLVLHTTQHLFISVLNSTINNNPSSVHFWSLVASFVSITHLFY